MSGAEDIRSALVIRPLEADDCAELARLTQMPGFRYGTLRPTRRLPPCENASISSAPKTFSSAHSWTNGLSETPVCTEWPAAVAMSRPSGWAWLTT
jgi:hypothetical protein